MRRRKLNLPIEDPNKTINTTTLELNEGIKLVLHTTKYKSRPQKDIKYEILRENQTIDNGENPSFFENSMFTQKIMSGSLEPSEKLFNATNNYSNLERENNSISRNVSYFNNDEQISYNPVLDISIFIIFYYKR